MNKVNLKKFLLEHKVKQVVGDVTGEQLEQLSNIIAEESSEATTRLLKKVRK